MNKTGIKAGKWTLTEEAFERQFAEATQRGEASLKEEVQARHAYYDYATNRLVIELKNGATHSVPCHLLQGLHDADPLDIVAVELGLRGASLHWEKLNWDFTVGGLVRGVFGSQKWMEQLAKRQNLVSKKSAAARSRTVTPMNKRQQKAA